MTTVPFFPSDAEVGLGDGRDGARCVGCPLAPTRQGFVWGSGPLTATLVIVGEAPGREEIAATPPTPFIGASGKIVRKGLPASTYVTNLRKCLPPADETPTTRDASIAHCAAAYLQEEFNRLTSAIAIECIGGEAAFAVAGVPSVLEANGAFYSRVEADAMRAATEVDHA